MTVSKLRFRRGDLVELPKRLGGGAGAVVASSQTSRGESVIVQRIVNGRSRQTVILEDELYRLPGRVEDGT